MAWIDGHKQFWRAVSLALLILAMIGPWTYEVINVPAEYNCNAPYVRLEGDFCGEPLSGIGVIFFLLEAFIAISMGLMTGAAVSADRAREYLFIFIFLLPLLPFFGTAFAIWKKDSRRLQVFHLATWGLAGIVGLFWFLIVIADPHPDKWRLWGVWSYMGLAVSMLLLEALALAAKKETSQRV